MLEKVLPRLAISTLEGHICFGLSQNPFLANKIHKALFARGFHVRYSSSFSHDVVPSMPVASRPVRSLGGPFRLGNKVSPGSRPRGCHRFSSPTISPILFRGPPMVTGGAVLAMASALTDVIILDRSLQRQATEAGIKHRCPRPLTHVDGAIDNSQHP